LRRPLATLAVLALITPALRAADAASNIPQLATGSAFAPSPVSKPLYGSQAPDVDPDRQRARLAAADGVDLYVETWLPAEQDGHVPPAKLPTVLIMTPYVLQGDEEYPPNEAAERPGFIEYMNARGFAVAQHHVRGTGESGGCLEQTAGNQIEDGARVVEYLGRDAEWTDGNVGMYGISYDAETQISVAGLGDKAKTSYLKAIVPLASVGGQYEYSYFDGVPYTGQAALSNGGYATISAMPGREPAPQHYPQKLLCQPEVLGNSADPTGNMTPFWKAREYRPGAPDITAATLYVHGLRDFNVQPITVAGFFDRIPATTPRKGLFGVWNHAFPDRHGNVEVDWERADWLPMVTAWFDRYLKGLASGVESWPDVQVQSSDGQWRSEAGFPNTGGPVGQLSLGPEQLLGLTGVDGSSAYTEGRTEADGRLVFETQTLEAPLQMTGQPVLDLWLTTDRPDGHIASRIEVVDAKGNVAVQTDGGGSAESRQNTFGFRSLQHLEPMPDNYFVQEQIVLPPTNTPIRVPVRFHPTDLTVPAGGKLRVTIAGQISYTRSSMPSGTFSRITVLHDCEHTSALRFLMPTPGSTLLDVRESEERDGKPLHARPGVMGLRDGGGLASAPVCGKAPERLPSFGPSRTASAPTRPAPARPAPAPAPTRPTPAPAPLPATGADLLPMTLAAVALVGLAVRTRRRSPVGSARS